MLITCNYDLSLYNGHWPLIVPVSLRLYQVVEGHYRDSNSPVSLHCSNIHMFIYIYVYSIAHICIIGNAYAYVYCWFLSSTFHVCIYPMANAINPNSLYEHRCSAVYRNGCGSSLPFTPQSPIHNPFWLFKNYKHLYDYLILL